LASNNDPCQITLFGICAGHSMPPSGIGTEEAGGSPMMDGRKRSHPHFKDGGWKE
jgi:hypothetical protein